MTSNRLLLFLYFFIPVQVFAQADLYPGTWKMEYPSNTGAAPVNIELQIAPPERNTLYPAHLVLQCDSFKADYEFLLVKKNNWELAISKNKYPKYENPFSLGNGISFLNGVFEFGKDLKGVPLLHIKRIQSKQYGPPLPNMENFTSAHKLTATSILNLLKEADIILKKINSTAWKSDDADLILSPVLSPAYFGLQDTFHVESRYAAVNLTGSKKANTDIISVALNGHTIFDQITLNKKKHGDDIILDTGLNILTLFADNFGSGLPNMGRLNLESANEKLNLDFINKPDSAATFIVVRLYCDQDKAKEISFQQNIMPGEKPLKENEKLISSIIATSRQITLAIWDDAAEDGDSISISIDGKWLVQGFPVKKNPQFIPVTLKPGSNTIDFIADNLGSIPPNTSVLEIIDGKKRKSFFMETNLGENNLIKIFYDLSGAPK